MPKKQYPERVRFFLADDVRSDSPKPMLLGFFPDDTVGVPMPSGMPDPTREAPIALQGLTILISFIGCRGSFAVETSLYQPDGSAVFEKRKVDGGIDTSNESGKRTINFIAKFVPFAIQGFGKFRFVIKLDRKTFQYEFSISRQLPQSAS